MTIRIKELPELERPYEKLELYGEKILSNAELLAIIIKSGTKESTSISIAQEILNLSEENTGDLRFLKNLTVEELKNIKGIGRVKAIQIKAICELAIRMSYSNNIKKITIKKPQDIANVLIEELRNEKNEMVKVVLLDNKNKIIKIKNVAIGGGNVVKISVKDILTEPLKINAPKIILIHNHPSGDSTPSNADIEFTERLIESSALVDIQLLDHIVIGDGDFTSIFSKMANN